MNNLVSIVIPLYNKENYIKRCIESLINQSYTNIEIIIVNDGSTDSSVSIVNQYKDYRIKLFNINNKGVSYARNYGIGVSKGEYIVFVDADDYVSRHYISTMIKAMELDIDLVITGRIDVYSKTEFKRDLTEYTGDVNFIPEDFYINGDCHPVWGKMYRKRIIKKNNIHFNCINISEDSFFNIDYLSHSSRVKILNANNYYYIHYEKNNLTSIAQKRYFDIYFSLYDKYKLFFENKKIDLSEKILYPQFYNLFLKIIKSNTYKQLINDYCLGSYINSKLYYIFKMHKGNGIEKIIKILILNKQFLILKILIILMKY